MSKPTVIAASRRRFLESTGAVAAAATLTHMSIPKVHAAGNDLVQVALVGCGGRGTGAASNALETTSGPIKLVAMSDVFQDKLDASYANLAPKYGDKIDVPKERRFIGFDAFKSAIDCLRPGDVAIFATPPAFRWVHFSYAIERGINIFMEKPITIDGPSTRRMLALGELSVKKNLKVGIGLMCRHCEARQELHDRIQNGEMGDLLMLRCYRMSGPLATCFSKPKPPGMNELEWQIRRFHSFLWASGGCYSDFLIHNIDECCWMKEAWPVKAHAIGGRHFREDYVDQNFDAYSVEYTFADGTKLFLDGRNVPGCHDEFASFAHGSKGLGVVSSSSHWPSKARIYKGHNIDKDALAWAFPQPETKNPYQVEWDRLVLAIREDRPHNEVKRGAEASLVTAMGRMAAHTGQIVTFEDALNHEHDLAGGVDSLSANSPPPVRAVDGKYPVPQPGVTVKREFEELV